MTLREHLETLPDDKICYIGAGSAFFFIGCPSEALARCNELTDEYLYDYETRIASTTSKLVAILDGSREDNLNSAIADGEIEITRLKEVYEKARTEFDMSDESDEDILDYLRRAMQEAKRKLDSAIQHNKKNRNLLKLVPKQRDEMRSVMQSYTEYLATYKRALDREVIEVYQRKYVKPYGDIIVVEGNEIGKYWDADEWSRRGEKK